MALLCLIKSHATINYNGEVFKCTARDFKTELKEGDLLDNGIINWNNKYFQRIDSKIKNNPCFSMLYFAIMWWRLQSSIIRKSRRGLLC